MKIEKPKMLVLGAITPSTDSARTDRLEYRKLEPTVATNRPFESVRMHEFWDAEPDSVEELSAAKELARQYMLMGALALQKAPTEESKSLWSERYTQATGELYGLPEAELARKLWHERETGRDQEQPYKDAAEQIRRYLDEKYGSVYDALSIDAVTEPIDPSGVADRFEAALKVLTDQYDLEWGEWQIERNDEKDSLSVVSKDKKIIIGMQRANIQPEQLKALFSHEVLVHGLRSVNGAKISEELGTGLADYLDAEEGLGVFVEYAINGEISEKNIDRYVDIAYALGLIDGQEHTRAELVAVVMERANNRNEQAETKKSAADLEKEVYAHINRIYRGSLGDEHIGIFTKDIAYHKGFIDMGGYITEQLAVGKSIDEIMSYIMTGKFDPTNQLHVDYIAKQQLAA